ncbi:TPA: glycosyltransferase [Candidatus Micrarchaeota archaeon]|nr:glycosyltransferase [Candidatus Micrarchaeota archaeon]HIH30340.1 glycosyltransferase [Candidatus Micrarchaeota archaeon]
MAKKVDVSILIPSYNEEKYIGACLASIKRQKFSGTYEIILGDGNSKDKTQRIAKDYGCRVVREAWGTPSGGRYAAAKAAKGRIFAITSADVELTEEWLSELVKPFERDRNVSWGVGSVSPQDGNLLEKIGAYILNIMASVLNLVGLAYVNADNLICRADAYKKCGEFNPKLMTSEDTDLGMRLMKTGKFYYIPRAKVLISMRRIRKWGYFNFVMFHTGNWFNTHVFARPAEEYAPVR